MVLGIGSRELVPIGAGPASMGVDEKTAVFIAVVLAGAIVAAILSLGRPRKRASDDGDRLR
jgi:hypothetical protein